MHTRRRVVAMLGLTAVAGCAAQAPEQSQANTESQNQSTNTSDTESESDDTETQVEQLSGREWYLNWIHGEDDEILEDVQGENKRTSISFSAIDNALETGMAIGGRNQAVANALETASQEYDPNPDYEDRHTHILSAIHQVLEQKDGDEWDFKIDSRLDATPSQEGWMKYSRVDVETQDEHTENGNKNTTQSEPYSQKNETTLHTSKAKAQTLATPPRGYSNKSATQKQTNSLVC